MVITKQSMTLLIPIQFNPHPPDGISNPDYELSLHGMGLGSRLRISEFSYSSPEDLGSWIRTNLK